MKHPWRRRAGCSALCQSFHAPPTPTLTRPTPSRLLSQPEFDSPTEEILWSLSKALEEGDVGKITDAILIKVARQCNPEGILRETFIQEEIATKYAEYGYGDLKSDVEEKTEGALKQLLMALLSDRLDYESQILEKAMKGLGTDEDCLITILCTLDEEDIFPLQQAYSDRYERSLEQAVVSETSGKFKRVLLLAGCDSIDEAYAKVCHSAISGMGTDCKALIRLMVTCPHEVMDKTREAYSRLYGNDLVSDMGGEWAIGGDFKRILCALAKSIPNASSRSPTTPRTSPPSATRSRASARTRRPSSTSSRIRPSIRSRSSRKPTRWSTASCSRSASRRRRLVSSSLRFPQHAHGPPHQARGADRLLPQGGVRRMVRE